MKQRPNIVMTALAGLGVISGAIQADAQTPREPMRAEESLGTLHGPSTAEITDLRNKLANTSDSKTAIAVLDSAFDSSPLGKALWGKVETASSSFRNAATPEAERTLKFDAERYGKAVGRFYRLVFPPQNQGLANSTPMFAIMGLQDSCRSYTQGSPECVRDTAILTGFKIGLAEK